MSKAFVRDDDPGIDPLDEVDEDALLPPPGVPRYITPSGRAALEHELTARIEERPRVASEAAASAASPESAEHVLSKRRLRDIDRRVRFLSKLLERLTVVEASPAQEGRVFFGATVTASDEDGRESTYRIVGPDEADPDAGRISVESPLAKAMLGKAEGDRAVVRRPRGDLELTIEAVRYER
jgi:transcription elongation factor GreB